jgi:hypothetical protein
VWSLNRKRITTCNFTFLEKYEAVEPYEGVTGVESYWHFMMEVFPWSFAGLGALFWKYDGEPILEIFLGERHIVLNYLSEWVYKEESNHGQSSNQESKEV